MLTVEGRHARIHWASKYLESTCTCWHLQPVSGLSISETGLARLARNSKAIFQNLGKDLEFHNFRSTRGHRNEIAVKRAAYGPEWSCQLVNHRYYTELNHKLADELTGIWPLIYACEYLAAQGIRTRRDAMGTVQPSSGAAQAAQLAASQSQPYQQDRPHRKPVPAPTHEKPRRPTSANSMVLLWHRYSHRTHIIAIAAIVALLILVIGLAAGLSTHSKSQNLPLPSANGGPYEGDLTYYDPGLGACGVTSANGDKIVAVSHIIFDAVQTGSNPNTNPLCGKKVRVKRVGGDVTVDLTVVDRCTGCQPDDLDMTEDTFSTLADVALGRVTGEWSWLD